MADFVVSIDFISFLIHSCSSFSREISFSRDLVQHDFSDEDVGQAFAVLQRKIGVAVLLDQQAERLYDLGLVLGEFAAAEADHALVARRDPVRCFLGLDEDIPFHADVGIRPQKVNLHAFLRTMEIDDGLPFRHFHGGRYRHDIGKSLPLYADPHRIASRKDVKNLIDVGDFPFLVSHWSLPLFIGS